MMSKRAIYLDERERDLARRVFTHADDIICYRLNHETGIERVALIWTKDSVRDLADKFQEPEDE